KYISQRKALIICAILALALCVLVQLTSGWATIWFVALLGFANSIMWPAFWPLSLNKLGHFTKTASAILVMCIAGGGVLPLIWGAIADAAPGHPEFAYLMLLPCYGIILFFAVKGYKIGLKPTQTDKLNPAKSSEPIEK